MNEYIREGLGGHIVRQDGSVVPGTCPNRQEHPQGDLNSSNGDSPRVEGGSNKTLSDQ